MLKIAVIENKSKVNTFSSYPKDKYLNARIYANKEWDFDKNGFELVLKAHKNAYDYVYAIKTR